MSDQQTIDTIATWMRERGNVLPPPGLLLAVRARGLQPTRARPRLLGALRPLLATAVVMVVVAVAIATIRLPQQAPSVASAVAPPVPLLLVGSTRSGGLELMPGDPATGLPVTGATAIPAGHHFQRSLSPDGTSLALVTWPREDTSGGTLSIIDLATWKVTGLGNTDTQIAALTWTPDSRELLWFAPTFFREPYGIGRGFQLNRQSPGSPIPETSVVLPEEFMPADARMLTPTRLAVYGQRIDTSYEALDVPEILTIDIAALGASQVSDTRLEGVVAGQTTEGTGQDAIYHWQEPGRAWDLARSRLLVIGHDRLTTVDLADEVTVSTHDIHQRTSLLDDLLAWLVPTASAKMPQPGERLTATLSPDGSRLYVTGTLVTHADDGYRQDPVGMQVIDTRDGSIISSLDEPVDHLVMSPDGGRLLLAGTTDRMSDAGELVGPPILSDVVLYDTAGLREISRIAAPAEVAHRQLAGVSWDGRHGYLMTAIPTDPMNRSTLDVIDLADGSIARGQRTEPLVEVIPLGA